ncbi:MAG TPA: ATP-binding protein [Gemmatimonadaceae bacterium]|nr:ATP-binding protein [Gemmatimonadaceae bacterium]
MSIVQRVAIVLALLLGLVGGIGLVVLDRARRLVDEVQSVARSHELRAGLAGLLRSLADAESAERGFLLTRDSTELLAYQRAVRAAPAELAALERVIRDPRQRERLARLRPLMDAQLAELDSIMRPVMAAARPPRGGERDSAHLAQIRALIGDMDAQAEVQLAARVQQARNGERLTLLIAGAGSLLAILVALFGVGVIRAEVAARARNVARVRASEARFRGAAEGSMDAFFLLEAVRDDAGRITDFILDEMNTGAERLLGRPRGELVGRRMGDLYPVTREDGFLERCARVVATGAMLDEEIPVRVPGMKASWLQQTIVRVGDGVAVTSRDITAKRRLEERMRQAQKMEAVGRLANGVAHDFNNVLAAIRASSDALALTLPPADARREDLVEITRAVDRAAQLTRQLLTFSRKQESRPTTVDLNLVVRGMEGLLRRLVARDVRLVISLDPGLGLVRVDEGQIEQVLLNLVVNARDAMPRGGTLEIATRNVDVDESRPHAHGTIEAGRYIALAVRDTGVGIDDQSMAHLFEPFFTTKPEGRGTGLGLATSYGIVQQSGGQITVASEPGQGAEFTIFLPRQNGRESPARAEAPGPEPRPEARRDIAPPRPEAPPAGPGAAIQMA